MIYKTERKEVDLNQKERTIFAKDLMGNILGFPGHRVYWECMLSCFSRVQLFATPSTIAARLLCPWDSPGKNTRVGCHFLLLSRRD